MTNFKNFRAALMATALVAFSSPSAFGQLQVVPPSDVDSSVKNAVAFTMICNTNNCIMGNSLPDYTVPKGYRLVVNMVSTDLMGPATPSFYLTGSVGGMMFRHVFTADIRHENKLGVRWGRTHHCFVVMDTFSVSTSSVGTGVGYVVISGYLVKM